MPTLKGTEQISAAKNDLKQSDKDKWT